MVEKNKLKLSNRIKSLETGKFSEDDIELLLIQIRELLPIKSFLKEICNFIAHRERNIGICHQRIDSRYAKISNIDKRTETVLKPEYIEEHKHKPWRFFSDQILDYFDFRSADKKIFELTILNGIDEIDGTYFKKFYGLNKNRLGS